MAQQILTLRIVESRSAIQKKIKDALKKKFIQGRVMEKASLRANIQVKNLFRRKMYESDTYRELSTSSFLVGELGLERSKEKIDEIIEQWVRSTKLKLRATRGSGLGVKGSFVIQMVQSNYADVFRMPEAKQRATSNRIARSNQAIMPWLKWLLIEGDRKIVIGYDVRFRSGAGRTGLAIMWKTKGGRSWSVPPGFTGTKDNNFVTEVIKTMEKDINRIMIESIARAIR